VHHRERKLGAHRESEMLAAAATARPDFAKSRMQVRVWRYWASSNKTSIGRFRPYWYLTPLAYFEFVAVVINREHARRRQEKVADQRRLHRNQVDALI